ncbi:uncharacterized protein [Nicotiana tomentosiformis]|uniref:uncharacterized protein n=1 Tax=Nicotiana tomentosiformis TaxID=4098 RepID=UPI00388C5FC1
MANVAVEFYQNQFTNEANPIDFSMLENVSTMVTGEQYLELCRFPTLEEVNDAVFMLSGDSASGPYGMSIFENIPLTQEIVTDIRLRDKPANAVIKLDMKNTYDRISWKYMLHLLRRMGFAEAFINMVYNLLNQLFEDKSFIGFGMSKWSCHLNHLAYADDTIIFASAHPPSLSNITYFARGEFPFTYLGCPIFYTIRRKDYYDDLVKKVKAKLHSWKGKLLSFGGKATLITSVLQSIPVHLLSALDPPNNILVHLHKIFARFFWSNKQEDRSRHWDSWKNLCLPKYEGGLGFRSLHDVSKALFAKLWWRFRTTKSLWTNFMCNKYCKKEIPAVVQFRRGSHVWRQMLTARE